ncbi:MAG: hypothetical protein DWI24_04635 [Planctomycetota bacterium]|nr:MAG: hypothetical protein DWI24_04635 [Planctomycetota bacterium]
MDSPRFQGVDSLALAISHSPSIRWLPIVRNHVFDILLNGRSQRFFNEFMPSKGDTVANLMVT